MAIVIISAMPESIVNELISPRQNSLLLLLFPSIGIKIPSFLNFILSLIQKDMHALVIKSTKNYLHPLNYYLSFIFFTVYSAIPTLTINAIIIQINAKRSVNKLNVFLKTKSIKCKKITQYTTEKKIISIKLSPP